MSDAPPSKYATGATPPTLQQQPETTTFETKDTGDTTNIGGNGKNRSRGGSSSKNDEPHPTVVPKRSSTLSKSIKLKKSKGGLTWGEEATKLSNMVRAKYACNHAANAVEVSQNQMKLLYMIHHYSFVGTENDGECWIRRVPVLVLLYEGIISQVFDYDYAPSLEVFGANRVYLNITQEGKNDIDALREKGLIEALTLASSEYDQCLAYTTRRAMSDPILAKMTRAWKDEVDHLLLAPSRHQVGTTTEMFTRNERLLEWYVVVFCVCFSQ